MGLGAEVLCAGARVVHGLDSDSEDVVILLGRRAWDVRRFARHWWPHGSPRSLRAISPHVTTWGGGNNRNGCKADDRSERMDFLDRPNLETPPLRREVEGKG